MCLPYIIWPTLTRTSNCESKVNLLTNLNFVLHHSALPATALYDYLWKILTTAWREQKANKNPWWKGESQHQTNCVCFNNMILSIKLLAWHFPNTQIAYIWVENYFIRKQTERLNVFSFDKYDIYQSSFKMGKKSQKRQNPLLCYYSTTSAFLEGKNFLHKEKSLSNSYNRE